MMKNIFFIVFLNKQNDFYCQQKAGASVHQCHLLVLSHQSVQLKASVHKHVSCVVQWGSRHPHWAC